MGNRDGGLVHYSSQLANSLSKRDEVVVIGPENLNREYFNVNVNIKEIKKSFLTSIVKKELFSVLDVIKLIKEEKGDVVHFLSPHIFLGLSLLFLTSENCLTTVHNPESFYISKKRNILLYLQEFFTKKLYLTFSSVIIVHGENLKKDILNNYKISPNRVRVIPIGDFSFFKKWSDNKIESNSEHVILFFGTIFEHKGIKYLIEAEKFITAEIPDVKVVIAGDGDFEKYSEMIINKDNYKILNHYISNKDVPRLFQSSSVVVLPYIKASQSGVIPIAYAFKKPVVVTNVGSLAEVVDNGSTGYIVEKKNSKELAKALIRILKDKKLQKEMGEKAFQKMKTDFNWDKIAEKTLNIYKSLIDGDIN